MNICLSSQIWRIFLEHFLRYHKFHFNNSVEQSVIMQCILQFDKSYFFTLVKLIERCTGSSKVFPTKLHPHKGLTFPSWLYPIITQMMELLIAEIIWFILIYIKMISSNSFNYHLVCKFQRAFSTLGILDWNISMGRVVGKVWVGRDGGWC